MQKITDGLKKLRKNIIEYIITNRLFISYVILSFLGTMFVRKYTIGTFWSFKTLIVDLGLILIIGAFGYLFKPKNQFKYYFVWTIIFATMDVINSIYYTFYTNFASFGSIATLGQVETVADSIFDKLRVVDIMYILIPLTFYFIHRKLNKSNYYYFIDKFEQGKKMLAATLIVGALCVGYSFGVAEGKDYSRLSNQWDRLYNVKRFGIILYQFNDLIQSLTPKINSLFGYEEALEQFNTYFASKEEDQDNKYTGILEGYNIVFVHMEGMQTFLMDQKFNGQEVTPNLNKLAKEGMFFKNFYPQISTGTSSDTEFTLQTGLLPAASGTVFVSYYKQTYFTLAKYLKNLDYFTFSMHGNLPSMWNRSKMHPRLGYDEMYFKESFTFNDSHCKELENPECINLGISDKLFFAQGVPIMENIEATHNNYMGTVITLSNHSPFKVASLYSSLDLTDTFEETDLETGLVTTKTTNYLAESAVGEYMKSANFADEALGEFLEYLKNSNAFDNTLFIFYGDHDAKLSQSQMNYLYNYNKTNGEVYQEGDPEYQEYDYFKHELNKKTPLIMWTKNNELKKVFKGTIDYYMGMYDLAPTILNMFGLYNKYTMGNDIFNTKNDNMIVFPNGNILTNKFYYNNSTEEYKTFAESIIIEEDYLDNLIEEATKRLKISNSIIVHNLLDTVEMGE